MAAASRQRAVHAADGGTYIEATYEEQLLIDSWPEMRVGFYNAGLLKTTVKGRNFAKTKEKLARDLHRIFFQEYCDMLCISELGEIGDGLDDALPHGTSEFFQHLWLQACILEGLSEDDESRTSSASKPVAIVLWDSHYVTLIREDKLVVEGREYIQDFVETQVYRGFQKITVRPVNSIETITVLHCHSPSSTKRQLTLIRDVWLWKSFTSKAGPKRFGEATSTPAKSS